MRLLCCRPKPTTTRTTEVAKETEGTSEDEAAGEEAPNVVDSDEQQQIGTRGVKP